MRLCFDTATSAFKWHYDPWINSPDNAREYFKDQALQFHAGSVVDFESGKVNTFHSAEDFAHYLNEADELVSWNGRCFDLPVLELLIGKESASCLWRKTHHDLIGWRNHWKLKEAIKSCVPTFATSYESGYRDARQIASFRERHAAETSWDAKATREICQLYLAKEDITHTFCDLP